jgi:exodeoxyribonuclease VII large subunit
VQGDGAAKQIVKSIETMNNENLADVIILGRGGGSLEDLWPFNEEIVARAIYASKIPIISAVGHETDFSISDFVADLRAPTPSAAAELAVPNIAEVVKNIDNIENRYKISLRKKVELMRLRYEKCMTRSVFRDPLQKINEKSLVLDNNVKLISNYISKRINEEKLKFEKKIAKLDSLSPLKTLQRGYSVILKDGKSINTVKMLNEGDNINIRLADGEKNAKII